MKWFQENWTKLVLVMGLFAFYSVASNDYFLRQQENDLKSRMASFDNPNLQIENSQNHALESSVYILGWVGIAIASFVILKDSLGLNKKTTPLLLMALFSLNTTGCYRPFKPIKLEKINSHEVAFLIPLVGAGENQKNSRNEEFYKQKLVFTQQVELPQQWQQLGYGYLRYNGKWIDAADLIKVDTQPMTREWTADANSGTSNKNEAIWVMTSDQVEFSVGWNITARVKDRDDAVKFLSNYPNGSMEKVLDSEVRAKLQTSFALAVTDLPMDSLRKAATPVINKVTQDVINFFGERGITITNLGITGGFVYKDKTIIETLVKVFNAEQEKNIAAAATAAQDEKNKKILLEATSKADALLKEKKAEAEGIKLVADAKFYELEKSKQNWEDYVALKNIELTKEMIMKWDGTWPYFFQGGGSQGHPNMLMQLPNFKTDPKSVVKSEEVKPPLESDKK